MALPHDVPLEPALCPISTAYWLSLVGALWEHRGGGLTVLVLGANTDLGLV